MKSKIFFIFSIALGLSFSVFAGTRVVENAIIKQIVVNQADQDKISVYFSEGAGACSAGLHGYKSKMTNDMWDKLHSALYMTAVAHKRADYWSLDGTCESFHMMVINF